MMVINEKTQNIRVCLLCRPLALYYRNMLLVLVTHCMVMKNPP